MYGIQDCYRGKRNEGLKNVEAGVRPMCVATDEARPQYVLAGANEGQVTIWDRRGGDGYPLCCVDLHESLIWELHVASGSRPGLLLSCGEDASVWMLDFPSATSIAGPKSVSEAGLDQAN